MDNEKKKKNKSLIITLVCLAIYLVLIVFHLSINAIYNCEEYRHSCGGMLAGGTTYDSNCTTCTMPDWLVNLDNININVILVVFLAFLSLSIIYTIFTYLKNKNTNSKKKCWLVPTICLVSYFGIMVLREIIGIITGGKSCLTSISILCEPDKFFITIDTFLKFIQMIPYIVFIPSVFLAIYFTIKHNKKLK